MAEQFVKGRTNNHLTWVMVDATDFATPESALSAATKIKIYGKLRSGTGVNFVSSGTGSLTNDIVHAGASVLGIYTIALAKADLSDASAAWYDQYIISLSATGAAYQTLIADGGIDISQLLLLSDAVSNVASYLVVMSGVQSDLYSLLSDHHSDFQSRVPKAVATNSQLSDLHSDLKSYLTVMSGIQSDVYSLLSDHHSDFQSRVPKAVATNSQLSDLHSDLKSYLAVMSDILSDTNSKIAGATSTSAIAAKVWSDYQSKVGQTPSQVYSYMSNILSALNAGGFPTTSAIAAKVWSDYGSRVGQTPSQMYSYMSNFASYASGILSDLNSRVTKAVATNSQLSDLHSDLKSYLAVMSGVLSDANSGVTVLQSRVASTVGTASDLVSKIRSDLESGMGVTFSQLYSVVNAASPTASNIAARVWSDYQSKVGSTPSQVYSYLSDSLSNLLSRITKAVATNSQLSDLHSDLKSYLAVMSGVESDIYSLLSDHHSDFQSRVPKAVATNSQLSDLHSDLKSYLAVMSGVQSDIYSLVSDHHSDFQSRVPKAVATNSQLSDLSSDIKSAIAAISVSITASDISDIASATAAAVGFTPSAIAAKVISDMQSKMGATLSQQYSYLTTLGSMVSDIDSALTSQFIQTSDAISNVHSAITTGTPDVNIAKVNGVTVNGAGTIVSPWGP